MLQLRRDKHDTGSFSEGIKKRPIKMANTNSYDKIKMSF